MRIDEIINQIFSRSFMGYDIEQVDVFLDEVIETLERNEAEKREMLAAMEYLMKKLEHGQKIPLADMKKAIDSERNQAKPSLPKGTVDSREEEQKTAARSIARGSGGVSKTMRTPKVSRVKGEEDAKAQIIEEAKVAIPQQELTPEEADKRAKRMSAAAVNWLDELLINIAEHESLDYEKPLQTASVTPAPQNQEKVNDSAAQPQELTNNGAPQMPKAQETLNNSIPQTPKAQEPVNNVAPQMPKAQEPVKNGAPQPTVPDQPNKSTAKPPESK